MEKKKSVLLLVNDKQRKTTWNLTHLMLWAHQFLNCSLFRVSGCRPITALLHLCDLEVLWCGVVCVCWLSWRRSGVFSVRWMCVDGVQQPSWRCSVCSAESEEEDQQPAAATEQQVRYHLAWTFTPATTTANRSVPFSLNLYTRVIVETFQHSCFWKRETVLHRN